MWEEYPETLRAESSSTANCFYNYSDSKLRGSDNWLAWSDSIKSDLDVNDYWKFYDGTYPRPTDFVHEGPKSSDTESKEALRRMNQQSTWDREARRAHHYLRKTIQQDQLSKLVKMKPTDPVGAWNLLTNLYRPKKATTILTALKDLLRAQCAEGSNVEDFVIAQETASEEISRLGEDFPDKYLALLLLSGLPPSWETWRSTIFARYNSTNDLLSAEITSLIREEYSRRKRQEEEDMQFANVAQQPPIRNIRNNSTISRPELDIDGKCYNCHKLGHEWSQCWSQGGGSHGKGTRQKQRGVKKSNQNELVHSAEDDRGRDAYEAGYVFSTLCQMNTRKETSYISIQSSDIIADTGASVHIVPKRDMLMNFKPIKEPINGVGGESFTSGTGDVIIKTQVGGKTTTFKLLNAKWVPTVSNTLISIGRLISTGGSFEAVGMDCQLTGKNGEHLASGSIKQNVYVINGEIIRHQINKVTDIKKLSWDEAHRRLGHLSVTSMRKLFSGNHITGISIDEESPAQIHCDSCRAAKATKSSFQKETQILRTTCVGEVFHTDLWGPSETPSLGNKSYFISFTDDRSKYTTLTFLKLKSDASEAIKNYIAWVHTQTGKLPKAMRSVNGGEFQAVSSYLRQQGIEHHLTAPYSPQQNGVAERLNRTLVEGARSMMIERNVPKFLWTEAVMHMNFIRNRVSTSSNIGNTSPYEIWNNKKPHLEYLREFGCDVWILNEERVSKLSPKSHKYMFTGYNEGSKSVRYYKAATHKILISRNFQFDTNLNGPLSHDSAEAIDFETTDKEESSMDKENEVSNSGDQDQDQEETLTEERIEEPSTLSPSFQKTSDRTLPIRSGLRGRNSVDYRQLNDPWYKPRSDKLESVPSPDQNAGYVQIVNIARDLICGYQASDPQVPDHIAQAKDSAEWPQWREAINNELAQLEEYGTWEICDLPLGRKSIGSRWVFTKKFDENGNLSRYKARLVAQGFSQIPGQDYSETFSPVMRLDTLRILCAIQTIMNLEVNQMDIKGAYLNGAITEEIYMRQPPGYVTHDNKVCRLKRSLYGLKQAGREWNKKLNQFLLNLNFKRATKEHCVYVRKYKSLFDVIGVWVDDLLLLSKTKDTMKKLKSEIHKEFEATDQGVPKYMLGIEIQVNSDKQSIRLSQTQYIEKIVSRFGISPMKPSDIPMACHAKFNIANNDDDFVDETLYRSAIGSLMYAAIATRPDIAFAVNTLAQFNTKPTKVHWDAVAKIFKYLEGSKNLGILYDHGDKYAKLEVTGFTDAGNGVNSSSGCPTSGGVFLMAGGAIKWISERQRGATLSEMESEFVASCKTAQSGIWIKDLLEDLGFTPGPVQIWIDNSASLRITENPESHKRALHIQRKFFWIQQKHEQGLIILHKVKTQQNVDDIFTKPLPRHIFEGHRLSLGFSD